MSIQSRKHTQQVLVGQVKVGGGAPIVVQSMTNTDTADVTATVQQIIELSNVGSEIVRVTVNTEESAKAVPDIVNLLAQKVFQCLSSETSTSTATSYLKNTQTAHRHYPNIASIRVTSAKARLATHNFSK